MTNAEVQDALKLAQDTLALDKAHPTIIHPPSVTLAKALLHLHARLEAADRFMDSYIGDFWEGCTDPNSNFSLACGHDRCPQCRLIAWRKLRGEG